MAVALASCSPATGHDPGTSPGGGEEVSARSEGAFVMRRDTTVLGTDRFVRTERSLEGEVHQFGDGRVEYRAELRRDETVSRLELRRFAEGETEPMGIGSIDFRGDSVVARFTEEGDTTVHRIAVPAGSMPIGWGEETGAAEWEQVLRRARRLGGDSVELPVLSLRTGQTMPVDVTFPSPDSARITIAGETLHVGVDGDRMLAGHTANGRWRLERVSPSSLPIPPDGGME